MNEQDDRNQFWLKHRTDRRDDVSQSVKYHAGQTGWWEVSATHDNVVIQFCKYSDGLRIRTVSFDGGQTSAKIPWPFGDNPTPGEVIQTAISTARRASEQQMWTSTTLVTGEAT